VRRVGVLTGEGRMHPAGLRAFEARRDDRTGIYSAEQRHVELGAAETGRFKANKAAWRFFQSQPPGYRKTAIHWVNSAKKAETQARRLETLIADSAGGLRIALLRRD